MTALRLVRRITYSTRDGRAVEVSRVNLCDKHLEEMRTLWGITVRRVGLPQIDLCSRCKSDHEGDAR